ncbi:MAG: hypothetical protein KU37_02420 [Sulfuricurvum sp. PC08-66]|nr:MAG: hypothetical protein KU37_02420 [Sulfuricurvum sp. PC08-66]
MTKKVFVDANILLDILDAQRASHAYSVKAYTYLLQHAHLFTSCDLVTTIYYLNAKKSKKEALGNIQALTKTLQLIPFANKEVNMATQLMLQESRFVDLEDTLQFVLAQKEGCELILTNDAAFATENIETISSKALCERLGL